MTEHQKTRLEQLELEQTQDPWSTRQGFLRFLSAQAASNPGRASILLNPTWWANDAVAQTSQPRHFPSSWFSLASAACRCVCVLESPGKPQALSVQWESSEGSFLNLSSHIFLSLSRLYLLSLAPIPLPSGLSSHISPLGISSR